jgi:hypothetical protein
MFATVPSSIDLRLSCLAPRIHGAGPDVLLQMMRAQLTSSNAMTVFERFGMATLPAPARITCISSARKARPPLRLLKS